MVQIWEFLSVSALLAITSESDLVVGVFIGSTFSTQYQKLISSVRVI